MTETMFNGRATRLTPFNLKWIHGYNPKVSPINLSTNEQCVIFYAATNCGVIYNWNNDQMKILQGHSNNVTCIAKDGTGKWLITADSGPDNILTIWDKDLTPCRTIFSPHGQLKIAKVALSRDAKYLLTIACHEKAVLHWWIWSYGLEVPHAVIDIETREPIKMLEFNPCNSEQFFMMSKHSVWIGESKKIIIDVKERVPGGSDHYYALKVIKLERPINQDIGLYKTFAFIHSTSQVLTVTSGGGVVIFGYTMEINYHVDSTNIENMKFVKAFKLDSCKINVVKFVDNIIVTGNENGEIKFYDDQLKLLYWCHRINVDCVKGLSFHLEAKAYTVLDPKCRKICECCDFNTSNRNPVTGEIHQKLMRFNTPSDATPKDLPFIFKDFIIQTNNQGIGYADFVHEKYTTILDYRRSVTNAIALHPEKPLFALGFANGTVELVNFNSHKVVARKDLRDKFKIVIPPKDDSINSTVDIRIPLLSVTCLKYSPSGAHLACGLNNGQLLFMDPISAQLIMENPYHNVCNEVVKMCYSCDSMMLALADKVNTVCLYKYDCVNKVWMFIGKHRKHFKDITTLLFTTRKVNDTYRLFSFGLDKNMVEYSISEDNFDILSTNKIDLTAGTLCAIEWPTPEHVEIDFPAILISDDENKYKIINCDTGVNKGTYLGPRYEQPVDKMLLVLDKCDKDYLVFSTKKNIGLQKLPLDGNPYKHIALLSHPKKIIDTCLRDDIDKFFVLGEGDNCILEWEPIYSSVDKSTELGGINLDPYYSIIEGGKTGWLFHEMRDLFYYIQLLCQGTYLPTTRTVGDFIPVETLPDIMRALGYFPSEFGINNMLCHAKYGVYNEEPTEIIDFESFVKLYLNHRPAFGENMAKIKCAFKSFATMKRGNLVIKRDDFVQLLCETGENFSMAQAWYLLSILCGHLIDDRTSVMADDFSFLPEEITFSDFIQNVLGIPDVDISSEQISCISSGSQQVSSLVSTDD